MKRLLALLVAASWMGGTLSPPALAQEGQSQRITLQLSGIDLVTVLKDLASQANLNIVVSRNVAGKVTLFVKEVDLWDAWDLILASNELACVRKENLLYVLPLREYEQAYGRPYSDPRVAKTLTLKHAKAFQTAAVLNQAKSPLGQILVDETTNTLFLLDTPEALRRLEGMGTAMDQPTQRETFTLNYAQAKDLAPKVKEFLTPNLGALKVDERTNSFLVTDTQDQLAELAEMIHLFDRRPAQVLIEAKIVQVALSDKFQLGVDWIYLANKFVTVKGLGALNLASGGQLKIATPEPEAQGDYKVVLEALRTFGETNILSEPRITALSGQEAKILVGSKEPYVTTQISQAGTGTSVTAEQINFIDVGVKLFVTPTISRDGFISMKIRPEVSSKTGTLTTAQKNEVPIVETSEAETSLLVQDGATIILGGLIKEEKSKDHQRIPVLGDIPVLGLLFRSTKDTTKKTELLVFLTPRLITGERQ
ncbi:MAG: type II secretion system protein GspD [Elusimicrobia bacterium]|nr:type II secretion system protein GspD [Elusimicrobiota bacterium]